MEHEESSATCHPYCSYKSCNVKHCRGWTHKLASLDLLAKFKGPYNHKKWLRLCLIGVLWHGLCFAPPSNPMGPKSLVLGPALRCQPPLLYASLRHPQVHVARTSKRFLTNSKNQPLTLTFILWTVLHWFLSALFIRRNVRPTARPTSKGPLFHRRLHESGSHRARHRSSPYIGHRYSRSPDQGLHLAVKKKTNKTPTGGWIWMHEFQKYFRGLLFFPWWGSLLVLLKGNYFCWMAKRSKRKARRGPHVLVYFSFHH